MIKIIKPGYIKEVMCQKCGALLSYDEKEDVKTDGVDSDFGPMYMGKYITCPQCKNKIVLEAIR